MSMFNDLQRLRQRGQRAEPAAERRGLQPGQRRHRGRPRRPGLQGAPGGLPDRADGRDRRAARPACASAASARTRPPGRRVHDPKHPGADAEGYVTYSNVNAVEEMVNMISASRSYQNNVEVMNTAKSLLLKTLQIGQLSTLTAPCHGVTHRHPATDVTVTPTPAATRRHERRRQRRPLPEAAGRADAEPGPAQPDGQRAGHEPDGADQHRQRHRQAQHHGAGPERASSCRCRRCRARRWSAAT